MRLLIVVPALLLVTTACEPGPVAIFQNPQVQRAVGESLGRGHGCGWGCADTNGDGKCSDNEFKLTADLAGTWNMTNCNAVDSTTGGTTGACAGSITYKKVGDNQLEQTNVGAVSEGSGAVAWASDCKETCLAPNMLETHEGVTITQHNSAHGAGCSQEVTNLLMLSRPKGNESWVACVLTVIESASPESCMPEDWWKVSVTDLTR